MMRRYLLLFLMLVQPATGLARCRCKYHTRSSFPRAVLSEKKKLIRLEEPVRTVQLVPVQPEPVVDDAMTDELCPVCHEVKDPDLPHQLPVQQTEQKAEEKEESQKLIVERAGPGIFYRTFTRMRTGIRNLVEPMNNNQWLGGVVGITTIGFLALIFQARRAALGNNGREDLSGQLGVVGAEAAKHRLEIEKQAKAISDLARLLEQQPVVADVAVQPQPPSPLIVPTAEGFPAAPSHVPVSTAQPLSNGLHENGASLASLEEQVGKLSGMPAQLGGLVTSEQQSQHQLALIAGKFDALVSEMQKNNAGQQGLIDGINQDRDAQHAVVEELQSEKQELLDGLIAQLVQWLKEQPPSSNPSAEDIQLLRRIYSTLQALDVVDNTINGKLNALGGQLESLIQLLSHNHAEQRTAVSSGAAQVVVRDQVVQTLPADNPVNSDQGGGASTPGQKRSADVIDESKNEQPSVVEEPKAEKKTTESLDGGGSSQGPTARTDSEVISLPAPEPGASTPANVPIVEDEHPLNAGQSDTHSALQAPPEVQGDKTEDNGIKNNVGQGVAQPQVPPRAVIDPDEILRRDAQIKRIQEENGGLGQQVEKLQQQAAAAEDEKQKAVVQVAAKESALKEQARLYAALTTQKDQVELQLAELRRAQQEWQTANSQMVVRITKVEGERDAGVASRDEQIARMQGENSGLGRRIEVLQQQVAAAEDGKQRAAAQVADKESALKEQARLYAALTTQKDQIALQLAELRRAQQEWQTVSGQRQLSNEEKEQFEKQGEALRIKLQENEELKDKLNDEVRLHNTLKGINAESVAERARLKLENSGLGRKNEDLQQQIKAKEKENQEAIAKLEEQQSKLLQGLRATAAELERQAAAAENDKQTAVAQVADKESALREQVRLYGVLRTEKDQAEVQLADLRRELLELQKVKTQMATKVAEVEGERDRLQTGVIVSQLPEGSGIAPASSANQIALLRAKNQCDLTQDEQVALIAANAGNNNEAKPAVSEDVRELPANTSRLSLDPEEFAGMQKKLLLLGEKLQQNQHEKESAEQRARDAEQKAMAAEQQTLDARNATSKATSEKMDAIQEVAELKQQLNDRFASDRAEPRSSTSTQGLAAKNLELQRQVDALEEERDTLKHKLQVQKEASKAQSAERKGWYQERVGSFKGKATSLDEAFAKFKEEEEKNGPLAKLKEARREKDELNARIGILTQQQEQFNKERQQEKGDLEAQNKALSSEIANYKKDLDDVTREKENIIARLAALLRTSDDPSIIRVLTTALRGSSEIGTQSEVPEESPSL